MVFKSLSFAMIVAGCLSTTALAQDDQTSKKDADTIHMMASYAGLGHYCWAYGVDWREISNEMNASAQNRLFENDDAAWLTWSNGYKAGSMGQLFSPQHQRYISVYNTPDVATSCRGAYQMVLILARAK